MSKSYFVRIDGRVSGPFSIPKLIEMRERGVLKADHELSSDEEYWYPANRYSQIFSPSTSSASSSKSATVAPSQSKSTSRDSKPESRKVPARRPGSQPRIPTELPPQNHLLWVIGGLVALLVVALIVLIVVIPKGGNATVARNGESGEKSAQAKAGAEKNLGFFKPNDSSERDSSPPHLKEAGEFETPLQIPEKMKPDQSGPSLPNPTALIVPKAPAKGKNPIDLEKSKDTPAKQVREGGQSGEERKGPRTSPKNLADLSPEMKAIVANLKSNDVKKRVQACKDIAANAEEGVTAVKYLCDVLLDRSPDVVEAALLSLEKLAPQLYKPLSKIILEPDSIRYEERNGSLNQLAKLGDQALPALDLLITILKLEALDKINNPRGCDLQFDSEYGGRGVALLVHVINRIRPEEPESAKLIRLVAGPKNPNESGRLNAFEYLFWMARGDDAKLKELVPYLRLGLASESYVETSIEYAGRFGPMAKELLPILKKLKLSPSERIRQIAAKAVELIEIK